MTDLILRFLIGGTVVSLFAVLGDIFRPKSFAGLFGAAPSIALATLGLTIHHNGKLYAAIEARSMMAGAVAMAVYAASRQLDSLSATSHGAQPRPLPFFLCGSELSFGIWRLCFR